MPCITHETDAERAEAARRHEQKITGPLHEEIDTLKAKLAEREAMLCGVLTALAQADGEQWHDADDIIFTPSEAVQGFYDDKETGVSYDAVLAWFEEHQKKDEQRRAREAAELEARKAQALKKLTLEERILLGFPGKVGYSVPR